MTQIYSCRQCRFLGPTIFSVFLHIWTEHLKVDVGLDREEARELLWTTAPYLVDVRGRQN